MMNEQNRSSPSLLELLGRSWQQPTPVAVLCFDTAGSVVAFATTDGAVAIAPVAETEAPEDRIRITGDLGQMKILPRSKPPAPMISVTSEAVQATALVHFGQEGFLVGGQDGVLRNLSANGAVTETGLRTNRPIVGLDHMAGKGLSAACDGEDLYLLRAPDLIVRWPQPPGAALTAVALSPDGKFVAGVGPDGLIVWSVADNRTIALHAALPSTTTCLRWSNDADRIACGLEAGGFSLVHIASGRTDTVLDFPGSVRTLAWGSAGELVASGAYRIAAWAIASPGAAIPASRALMTGHAGFVLVETVATHPKRDLVAAGYADGRIVVARIGARDELLVRDAGGAVTALGWSPDGAHLAFGDADGQAGIVTFPKRLFK